MLVRMPLNLAVFDVNAGDGIINNYPDIDKWYIGGHSLGGAMAGAYLSKNADSFDGIIFLAAYSSTDISSLDKKVISIYGTNDGVMNRENYEKYKSNLPSDFNEYVIDGGCHSYFGDYGMQRNDGIPTISRDEQMAKAIEYIDSMI